MDSTKFTFSIRPGFPDFKKLPWDRPLSSWDQSLVPIDNVSKGISRHPVQFVNYDGDFYALKELPENVAESEFTNLSLMGEMRLPGVFPVGHVFIASDQSTRGILITQYLDNSIPYRSLFMQHGLERYRKHLLDAMASLLVQIHLAGVFWGDCSLSNTLFRRDAGTLQAYLVDAETTEIFEKGLSPILRLNDLQIMEENIIRDLIELESSGQLLDGVPIVDTAAFIRLRYQILWEEVKREEIIKPDENYRIQERVRYLNQLGFAVGGIDLKQTENGTHLRVKVIVTDRHFHRNQLYPLTGLDAQEKQAQQIMNEIHEVNATLSQIRNYSVPLSAAAYHWLEFFYQPTIKKLLQEVKPDADPVELYCQILEHKWFLSERAQRDVGHQKATEHYILTIIGQNQN